MSSLSLGLIFSLCLFSISLSQDSIPDFVPIDMDHEDIKKLVVPKSSKTTHSLSGSFSSIYTKSRSEDLTQFEVMPRSYENFFHFVSNETVPTEISIGYFVSSSSNEHINLHVYSPSGIEILVNEASNEGYAHVEAREAGFYQIQFNNRNVRESLKTMI